MRILTDTRQFSEERLPSAVTIGVYDGVHLGHQAIIGRCIAEARRLGLVSVVLTFENNPRMLTDGSLPCALTDVAKKLELLSELGVDYAVVLTFDEEFASMEPEEFCQRILSEQLGSRVVCVGKNFRFGRGGRGDSYLLAREGSFLGFDVLTVPLVEVDGNAVSSTLIRSLISEGRVGEAKKYLGRPYRIAGRVVRGHSRGKSLGFPTANISLERHFCLPREGVYAGYAFLHKARLPCAINVGTNPTFHDEELGVEAYLIGFEDEIYGKTLELEFHERLRDELEFESGDELVEQIRRDVALARKIVEG